MSAEGGPLVGHARQLVAAGAASAVVVVVREPETAREVRRALAPDVRVLWAATTAAAAEALADERPIVLPFKLDRMQLVSYAVLHGIVAGRVQVDQPLACLGEGRRGIDLLCTLTPSVDIDLAGILEWTADRGIVPDALLAALQVAVELGSDRTGRAAGSLFTVGDADAVLATSEPYPFEPFGACAPADRQITAAATQTAVQKYARVDGVFVLRGDGVIERFVKQVNPRQRSPHLDPSTGSRHAAAAGITLDTRAIALLVTESGGDVKLFKDGRILLTYKPR